MRSGSLSAAVVVTLVAGVLAATPAGAQEAATVLVRANAFDPFEVSVDPAGTVSWVVQEAGHTIVADDDQFAFRGDSSGLPAGTSVSFQAGAEQEYVNYYCEIHGGPALQGMSGRIRVGDPPVPPPSEDPLIRIPQDQPTLAAAAAVAAPGSRIEIAPGTYGIAEAVEVDVDDLTIARDEREPGSVELVPQPGQRGFPATALHVTGSRVRIENLSVNGFRDSGIHLDGADGASLVDVVVSGAGFTLDGILLTRVTGATLRGTTTSGFRRAGVFVSDCTACGVLIDAVVSEGNLVGILAEATRGVIVRGSMIFQNSAGVVARAGRAPGASRSVVIEIRGSEIRANDAAHPANTRDEDRILGVGAGVWLSGVSDSAVTGNSVVGNGYGVAVAGHAALTTAVTANQLEDNADADLAWDGTGARTCFAANTSPGDVLTSDPPMIEELYPCDRPTVGVPFPVVTARLLMRALAG